MTHPRILVIVGPTASGKSALGIHIARILDGEIISADSRQIYSDFTIGTAKPSVQERGGIRHHLIDCFPLEKSYTAGQFGIDAARIIEEIAARGRVPVIVGGSGLYLQALIDGFFDGPSAPNDIRERLYERLRKEGGAVLLEELRTIDPEIARTMNYKTVHRIIRALEVYEHTGVPLSQHHHRQNPGPRYNVFMVGLTWTRTALYERINARVDAMIEEGFIDEVRNLNLHGFSQSLNALRTVGYQEVMAFLRGEYPEEEVLRLIKRNTRRYAKRQLTWFRRDTRIHWYPISREIEMGTIAQKIADEFRQRV